MGHDQHMKGQGGTEPAQVIIQGGTEPAQVIITGWNWTSTSDHNRLELNQHNWFFYLCCILTTNTKDTDKLDSDELDTYYNPVNT